MEIKEKVKEENTNLRNDLQMPEWIRAREKICMEILSHILLFMLFYR